MNTIVIKPSDISRTFTLISRHDTHYFLNHELPEFLTSLSNTNITRFRNYFSSLRSGEYIPKDSYSDNETNYVYLTIGQFSGQNVSFEELTFLEELKGKEFEHIKVNTGDLIVTRSGTVGVVHIFNAPDDKIYIPSHHLAVIELPKDSNHSPEYLRLLLQTEFARKYFWAFASGKGQKEISNWSIKSIPIPQCEEPTKVAEQCLTIEKEIRELQSEIDRKSKQKEQTLFDSLIKQTGKQETREKR